MQIFIHFADLSKYPVDVNSGDTVENLKAKIEEIEGFTPE